MSYRGKRLPPGGLKQNIPFDADTARFDPNIDAWPGATHRRGLHNHDVVMLIMMVMVIVIMAVMTTPIMMIGVMMVMTSGVLVTFVVCRMMIMFMGFAVLLMMTAMAGRTGGGDERTAQYKQGEKRYG